MRGARGIYPQEEKFVNSGRHLVYKCLRNNCVEGEDSILEAP